MKIVIDKSAVPLQGIQFGSPIEIAERTRIRDVLRRAGVDEDELYLLPAVNGVSTNLDRVLCDGDRIQLFRLSAGG